MIIDICLVFSLGMLEDIRCMIVVIWLVLSWCLGNSVISIEVLVWWLLWMKVDGLGSVRCMCVECIDCSVLMVLFRLVFSICW